MKSVLAGALGLVALQVVLASPTTAPRLGQLGVYLAQAVARWTDPTVPLFGAAGKPNLVAPPPVALVSARLPSSGQAAVGNVVPFTRTTL